MDAFFFYSAGILMVVSSLIVVTRRNPVYSAIWLVFFFTMTALAFLVLRSPFLAIIQVLLYGGAIVVLFLFVLMLLNLKPEELEENVSRRRKALSAAGAAGLFVLLVLAIRHSPTVHPPAGVPVADMTGPVLEAGPSRAGEVEPVGRALFTDHVLPFELTSILIFVAIIGAIYLTKTRRALRAAEPAAAAEPRAGARVAAGEDAR